MMSLGLDSCRVFGEKNREFSYTINDFKRISSLMYQKAGVCLPLKKADMVYGRLARRLRVLGLNSFSAYLDVLTKGAGTEWGAFIGSLTTHLTDFFREEHHFPILAGHVQKKTGCGRLKLWSCAASTGEEPYSMAIVMAEQFGTLFPPVDILATDVDRGVIETARMGIYPIERIASLSERIVRRYFLRGGGPNNGFVKIRHELQQMVTFSSLNLLDSVWSLRDQYDAIFCRNVLIYFDKPTQKQVLQHCHHYLKSDGLFFAGHSENLNHVVDLFDPCGKTVYRPRQHQAAHIPELCFSAECYTESCQ